ncbi:fumarylacetoacetate hydrolase family protein [Thalassotalea sp. PLHSN55]|uniref:fumarylacetoacetate hydrolase family protein n=1 Tax=Thalassotalea sp. PLHSN55 TaxID=3435888 RepID=UPI003F832B95
MNDTASLVVKYLPEDQFTGLLIGRVWHTDKSGITGPSPVLIKADGVYSLTTIAPTISELLENTALADLSVNHTLEKIGSVENILLNTVSKKTDTSQAYFLAPIDTQAIKACGVTFVCSMVERVIEESAGGDARKANQLREQLSKTLDVDFREIVPGSEQAMQLKAVLIEQGLWSQYLEVGIGPDAEVFTKSQPLSSVGLGDEIGIHRNSSWNNPEPEVVLIVNSQGDILGATLGNDVNLRDIEGRSALLLGKAKDNNASCSIGPFIRLFDQSFTLDDVRTMTVNLSIQGTEGFVMQDHSDMKEISRDVTDLVKQTRNSSHQYPDGIALFTGTLFAPTQDRGDKGAGFTHHIGDKVSISSSKLGCLENTVNYSNVITPWTFGTNALMKNLSARKLL